LLIAAGSIVGYAMSRTVGLPYVAVKEWFEAIGIISLVVEILFVLLSVKTLTDKNKTTRTFAAKIFS
jgi:hypothetical protein